MNADNLSQDLKSRGLIEQFSGESLDKILSKPRKVYLGVDPTADSLHVGNLSLIFLVRRLSDAGFSPLFLVGGATGMIGDPKEKGERPLLDEQTIRTNTKALSRQLTHLMGRRVKMVNNADWLKKLNTIAFLRDVGKHFTVNQLIKRDIIKRRLEQEDSISFTEFSYSLLQAYDFWYLFRKHGVDMQVGGSDQWANIVSGVDLIRRKEKKVVHALTSPIIVDKRSGKKFGKSEGNAIWLDPHKTTPFDFYQFWVNLPDGEIESYLKVFTFIPLSEIDEIMKSHNLDKPKRHAQRRLAFEVTSFVHGQRNAEKAEEQSLVVFGQINVSKLSELIRSGGNIPENIVVSLSKEKLESKIFIKDLLLKSGLAESKNKAHQLIEGGAVSVNDEKIEGADALLDSNQCVNGKVILKKGKELRIISFQ